MKIGIAVTTTPNRKEHSKFCLSQINNWNTFLNIDDNNEGVAISKNECLHQLFEVQNCDFAFLFDDDCFPIKSGWEMFFIDNFYQTGQNHFIYCKPNLSNEIIESKEGVDIFNNCNGCFAFVTKEAFQKVGYFNKEYGLYGFEHADYSNRIYWAGLNTFGAYLCPKKAGEYIYSLDIDNHLSFNKQLNHFPSIEPARALNAIRKAQKVYMNSLDTKQIYYSQ